jgi:aspartokinase-like uncharacterized kinase
MMDIPAAYHEQEHVLQRQQLKGFRLLLPLQLLAQSDFLVHRWQMHLDLISLWPFIFCKYILSFG